MIVSYNICLNIFQRFTNRNCTLSQRALIFTDVIHCKRVLVIIIYLSMGVCQIKNIYSESRRTKEIFLVYNLKSCTQHLSLYHSSIPYLSSRICTCTSIIHEFNTHILFSIYMFFCFVLFFAFFLMRRFIYNFIYRMYFLKIHSLSRYIKSMNHFRPTIYLVNCTFEDFKHVLNI